MISDCSIRNRKSAFRNQMSLILGNDEAGKNVCPGFVFFISCFKLKDLKFMVGKYKVITLCGSTRFRDEFIAEQKRLTLEGNIVISVGLFGHAGDPEVWREQTKIMLDDMHKRKIDLADEIFVINVGGYIGESTRSEIEYAIMTGKAVRYLV